MKYLDYFINPNNYMVFDSRWLIKKIEKRNSNWSYRWISVRGGLILIKFVLEGIHVQWLAFTHISSSIL